MLKHRLFTDEEVPLRSIEGVVSCGGWLHNRQTRYVEIGAEERPEIVLLTVSVGKLGVHSNINTDFTIHIWGCHLNDMICETKGSFQADTRFNLPLSKGMAI